MFEATYSIEIPFIYRATAVDTIFNESLAKSIRAAVNAPRATVPRYIISTSGRSWRVCVRGAFTKRIHEDLRVNRAASRTLFDSLPISRLYRRAASWHEDKRYGVLISWILRNIKIPRFLRGDNRAYAERRRDRAISKFTKQPYFVIVQPQCASHALCLRTANARKR